MSTRRKAPLRAVGENEVPPSPKEIKSVLEAANEGSRLDVLIQMRTVIARALDSEKTLARDLAALSKRLMEIEADISALKRQQSEEAEQGAISGDEEWSEEAI